MQTPKHFGHAFTEDSRRRSLSASLVFAVFAILASLGGIGWGLYMYFTSMSLLGVVGGPVAAAIPYIMAVGGVINLIVAARSVRVAVVARRVGSGHVAKSIFRIGFNIAALLLPAFVIDTGCGLMLLFSAALAELTSRSSLFAASFDYYTNAGSQNDLDSVQSHLHCCGAQSPMDWARPISRTSSDNQSPTSLPMSCCPSPHVVVDDCQYSNKMVPGTVAGSVIYSFHRGCIEEAVRFLYMQHFWSSGIAFVMGLMMLLVAVCQRLAQTSARAALESGDSGGPATAWFFRDPRSQSEKHPPSSLWTDESPGWPRQRELQESVANKSKPGSRPAARTSALKDSDASSSMEELIPAPQSTQPLPQYPPPPPPPPLPPQIRPIKHIRLPDSSGNSTREEMYEVYSTSGPPVYYGPDGLPLNHDQVQILHSPENQVTQVSSIAENHHTTPVVVEPSFSDEDVTAKSLEPRGNATKKKRFSFARVIRRVVRKSKSGGRQRLSEERSRSCHTSDTDLVLKESKHRGSHEEKSRLLRPSWTKPPLEEEMSLLASDDEANESRRSRKLSLRGMQKQRINGIKNENQGEVIPLQEFRFPDKSTNDQECQFLCQSIYPVCSSYYTSSDMPTEISVTPVPSSEENYVMGALRRSPSLSKTSTCSQWSSKESSPERQPLFRDIASQTSFVEEEDTTIENSHEQAAEKPPNKECTSAPVTAITTTIPFYGVLTEEEGGVRVTLEQIPKVSSLSYVITDERMPVEVPRRSVSQKASESFHEKTVSQLTTNSLNASSKMTQSTEGHTGTICICQRTDSSERSVVGTLEDSIENLLPSEPKRQRISSETSQNRGSSGRFDCGVPNESSAAAGLLSNSTVSWKAESETECSDGFDAPLPPIPPIRVRTDTLKNAETTFPNTRSRILKEKDEPSTKKATDTVSLVDECQKDSCIQPRLQELNTDNSAKVQSAPFFREQIKSAVADIPNEMLSPVEGVAISPAPTKDAVRSYLTASYPTGIFQKLLTVEDQPDGPTFKFDTEEIEPGEVNELRVERAPYGYQYDSQNAARQDVTMSIAKGATANKTEQISVCGLADNVSLWFPSESSKQGTDSTSRTQNEKHNIEMGSTVQNCLIESSKQLVIAVPDHKSVQFLYKGHGIPKESSEILLEDNLNVGLVPSLRHTEATAPNFAISSIPLSAVIENTESTGNNTSFSGITSETKENELVVPASFVNPDERNCIETKPNGIQTENFLSPSLLRYCCNTAASIPKPKQPMTHSGMRISPLSLSSLQGSVKKSSTDHGKDGKQKHLLPADRSFKSYSVASGVASLGIVCLKEYSHTMNFKTSLSLENAQEKDLSKEAQPSITASTSTSRDSGHSYTIIKKPALSVRRRRRQNKTGLQKPSSSRHLRQGASSVFTNNLKDVAGAASASMGPEVLSTMSKSMVTTEVISNTSDNNATPDKLDIAKTERRMDKGRDKATSEVLEKEEQMKTEGTGSREIHERNRSIEGSDVLGDKEPMSRGATTHSMEIQTIQQFDEITILAGVPEMAQDGRVDTSDISNIKQLVNRDEELPTIMGIPEIRQRTSRSGITESTTAIPDIRQSSEGSANVAGFPDSRDRITYTSHVPGKQQRMSRNGSSESIFKHEMSREETIYFARILSNEQERGSKSARIFENQQRTRNDKATSNATTFSDDRPKMSRDGESTSDIISELQERKNSYKATTCLFLPEYTSTDTSHESADSPMPPEPIDLDNRGNKNSHTKHENICSKLILTNPNVKVTECVPSLTGSFLSSTPGNDHERSRLPSTTSNDTTRDKVTGEKLALCHSPTRKSVYFDINEEDRHNKSEVSPITNTDADNIAIDSAAVTDTRATIVFQKCLETTKDSNCPKAINSAFKQLESTNESCTQPGMTISRENTSGKQVSERRENFSGSSGSSGIQTHSLSNTLNQHETVKRGWMESDNRHVPISRPYHRVVNIVYGKERPPPTEGEFTPHIERKKPHAFESAGSEVLVIGSNTLVCSRLPNPTYSTSKTLVLENIEWTLEEDDRCEPLPDQIEVPLAPFLEFIAKLDPSSYEPKSLQRFLSRVISDLKEDEEDEAKLRSRSPVTEQKVESPKNGAEENTTLDRRKDAVVRNSGDAPCTPEELDVSCKVVGKFSSTYRFSQRTNMPEMEISPSQFTTNIFISDPDTTPSSINSSSSYKCKECDCSANRQTSVEDSSYLEETHELNRRKSRKQMDESGLEGYHSSVQSSSSLFDSAGSEFGDFFRSSDFESAESTSTTSTITGSPTSETCQCVPERSRRSSDIGSSLQFHRGFGENIEENRGLPLKTTATMQTRKMLKTTRDESVSTSLSFQRRKQSTEERNQEIQVTEVGNMPKI